ncbi:hypothetical protein KP79_PYT22443 [Mizuhopecten yessoensis]|uniref:Uncharacterized protein n=2 Tax=Mizuhopecten yessoensis TaxID=6573 RepID=A0A210QYL2_MIZYE|nr:hypothetical protein KP79_PYT22443 [Mizuhopecten yessoensis]
MDRVDLSTRRVYLPSFQFRKTFEKGKHKPLLFTSPYVTTYEVVCQHQVYGVLWLLGQYGRDVLTCLNDICLPDWSIQYFRDSKTGKLDVTKWLRNNELRQRHQHHHPHQQQQHSEARTPPNWIRSIIEGNIEDFKADLQRGIGHPDDGWTPLHFAILIHQHDLVRFILETRRGDSETATHTLLPRFILDELKYRCQFEYNYVYKHTVGFTPLLLATFIGDKVAIDILGTHVTGWQLDMKDCLTLAYCEDTENNLLNIMCGIGEKHVCEKYNLNVKLHSVYEKDCPNRRILISSSNDIQRRIEEDLVPVRLILDNENIIREFLNHSKTDSSARNTPLLGRVIESHADWLWQSNSNLNAIMPGHTSSLSEEHQTDEAMVVLHCSHKGFIHTHELPFKRYLHKDGERVRVHVIQGLFRLGPLNSSSQSVHDLGREKGKIQTGYKIKYGKAPRDMMATLGMMVEDLDGNTGILTCAHTFLNDFLKSKSGPFYDRLYKQDGPLQADVFLRKPELLVSDHVDINEGEGESKARYRSDHEYMEVEAGEPQASSDPDCEMADAEQATRCGYVRRVLFQTDTDVAIDVALIMLNSDAIECCPKLYFFPRDRDDEKIQLKRVGTNFKRKDLKFATGNKFKQPVKQVELGYKVIKCGITTGLSVGALAFCDNRHQAQVKVTDDQCQVTVNSNVFILKGQIVVERTADKEFFQEGDSGSAVFVKAEDSFECLGIAIGGMTSSSETLVTPIESVLRALKEQPQGASQMQEYKLKTFF